MLCKMINLFNRVIPVVSRVVALQWCLLRFDKSCVGLRSLVMEKVGKQNIYLFI